ncbi:MAG: IS110 family transposase [Pseudonocardiaceae bacterium]
MPAGDAHVLADMVRTDAHQLRPVAGDTALAEGIKVVARAHQSMIWDRTRHVLRLRSVLRAPALRQPAALAGAYAVTVRSTVAVITVCNSEIATLQGQVEAHFGRHSDVEIYRSQPGLGEILGARGAR